MMRGFAPTVIPAQAGIQNPGSPRRGDSAGVWIPAFAGMTVGGGNDDKIVGFHMALAAQWVSPSPNPLPLGEGFWGLAPL